MKYRKVNEKEYQFVQRIVNDLSAAIRYNKTSLEKLAASYSITNKNLIKELTELAIVISARSIAHDFKLSSSEKYRKIVELYSNQVNLSMRTSHSVMLQQYSTPAPISFLAGTYVATGDPGNRLYFEPSAGNGLLTIALPYNRTIVNELDDVRLGNLFTQPFKEIMSQDATKPFNKYLWFFDGIVTNPPFGRLVKKIEYEGFSMTDLDHLMALRALDCMKSAGRAAIIIGGHTHWDEKGRIQAGKNRIFFNYLYRYYLVDDVMQIDGHKLYSRQGTSFDVRMILIRGRKEKPEGVAPLKSLSDIVVTSFEDLFDRVMLSIPKENISSEPSTEITIAKLKLMKMKLKLLQLRRNEKREEGFPEIEHQKGTSRFTPIKEVPREIIITDPKTFQGRTSSFAQETVDKIVGEGYDKSREPIEVWWDESKGKYVVISGHSRWQASEILFQRGDTSLATMPVKVFIGDKDDAIDYAIIESNRSGKAEGLISDIVAYKKAATKGMNKNELLRYFKPESYLSLLKDLSKLNSKGRFIEYLNSTSEQSFPYLKRNASWVGQLRHTFSQLTDQHENELFDYFYKGKSGLKLSKDNLFNMIDKRIMTFDFNPEKPLNLQNLPSSNAYSDPIKEQIKEIEKEINDLARQRSQKEELIARAKAENMPEMVTRFQNQVSDLNRIILRKIEEKQRQERMVGEVEKTVQSDLFSLSGQHKNKVALK